MSRAKSPAERIDLAVFDGRDHIGNLVDLGCKVVAELVDGTAIGSFPSRQAATHAIVVALAGRSQG